MIARTVIDTHFGIQRIILDVAMHAFKFKYSAIDLFLTRTVDTLACLDCQFYEFEIL